MTAGAEAIPRHRFARERDAGENTTGTREEHTAEVRVGEEKKKKTAIGTK